MKEESLRAVCMRMNDRSMHILNAKTKKDPALPQETNPGIFFVNLSDLDPISIENNSKPLTDFSSAGSVHCTFIRYGQKPRCDHNLSLLVDKKSENCISQLHHIGK